MIPKNPKQYGYWMEEDQEWYIYDTIEEVLSEYGDGVEVFEFSGKSMGSLQRKTTIVKVSTKKKRNS